MRYAPSAGCPTSHDLAYIRALPLPDDVLRRTLPRPRRDIIDFSSNDYLGLAHDRRVVAAATRAGRKYGASSTGSRLLSGNSGLVTALERRIARDKGSEAALVFSSGYQLNATVIAALLDARVLGCAPSVFADKLVHASMHAGIHAAGARERRYPHSDLARLRQMLEKSDPAAPRFIFTESVFGMDGDITDVQSLVQLAREFDALVYIDEAHATGVFGERGYGLATAVARSGGIVMGTFGKALGGAGAYVACSRAVRDYVLGRCAGFIYSTAPPPSVIAAAYAAWTLLPTLGSERVQLQLRAEHVRAEIRKLGFTTGVAQSHIVPIIIGDAARAHHIADSLTNRGIIVGCIRPPTVPPGTTRLRIALRTDHKEADIDSLLEALATV